MPVNLYECMLMLDTTKVSGDLQSAVQQIHHTLEKHKAEVLASRPWDERRLTYPIRKQKKALFYLLYFRCDSQVLKAMEHDFVLNENVLRHLVLKILPKLEETMLAIARDPHALALQGASEESADEFEMMGGRH